MKPMNVLIILILASIVGGGSVYLFGKDNPVEEVAEEVIQAETGLKVDLTPESKKK